MPDDGTAARITDADQAPDGPHLYDKIMGALIRLKRKQKGISQEKLAERVGRTFQQIQKYERGANRIALSVLVLLADALEIPLPQLMKEFDEQRAATAASDVEAGEVGDMLRRMTFVDYVKVFGELDEGEQELALDFVKMLRERRRKS